MVNGIAREAIYARRVSENRAHQISGLTGVAAFAAYFWALNGRWPLADRDEALRVGAGWLVLTVAFEFSFGRLVAKLSWKELLADYDVAHGRTWPFVLAWLTVGPEAVRRLQD